MVNVVNEQDKKFASFEDLNVWKRSMALTRLLIKEVHLIKTYSLKDQILRSAVSIPSNIAEGFERDTNKEFIRYLYIAKGSCGELRTQLMILKELGQLEEKKINSLINNCYKLSSMLSNLILTRKRF